MRVEPEKMSRSTNEITLPPIHLKNKKETPVEITEDVKPKNATPICHLLLPQKIVIKILGLKQSWPPPRGWGNFATFRLAFAAVIWIIELIIIINLCYLSSKTLSNWQSSAFAQSFALITWNLQALYAFYLGIKMSRSREFYEFRVKLMEADGQNGIKKNMKCNYFKLVLYYISATILTVFAMISFVAFNIPEIDYLGDSVGYSNANPPLIRFPGSNYIFLVVQFYVLILWFVCQITTLIISNGLVDKLTNFNQTLAGINVADIILMDSIFRSHHNIVKACEKAESLLSTFLLVIYSTGIPLTLVLIFALIVDRNTGQMNLILGMWLFSIQIQVITISLTNAKINEEKSGALFWLSNELDTVLGISVGGFGTVTKGLMLTVFSILVSYLTLLLQTHMEVNDPILLSITQMSLLLGTVPILCN